MTGPTLAFSLSNSLTKVGAIAALAALVGIALLALLFFVQDRELKRLREWAGRSPERFAELEQRLPAEAAAQARRVAGQAVRVIPRGSAGAPPAPAAFPVGAELAAAPVAAGAVAALAPIQTQVAPETSAALENPAQEDAAITPGADSPPSGPPVEPASNGSAPAPAPEQEQEPSPAAAEVSVSQESAPSEESSPPEQSPAPVPAPPPAPSSAAAGPPSVRPLPPAPVSAAASRPAPAPQALRPAARAGSPWQPGDGAPPGGYRYLREERRLGRKGALIGGALAAVVLVVVLVLVLSGGSSPVQKHSGASTGEQPASHPRRQHATTVSVAKTSVIVLNSTPVNGLAHRVSTKLQGAGYVQAQAAYPQPGGDFPATVVQYARGDRSEAEGVAKVLHVNQVEALTSGVRGLTAGSMVAVVVGANEAGAGEG